MKASIKFREETNQYPLLRAKVPLSVLTLPLQSSLSAGESKELTLNLSTFFKSGPSIKLAYRPNDPLNPFSLIIKTGTGPFGSPLSNRSPLLMSAEFNLINKFPNPNPNPKFMLHFKPNFGDFTIKKSRGSEKIVRPMNGVGGLEDDPSIEMVEPVAAGGKRMMGLSPTTGAATAGFFSGVLEGAEIAARTSLPVGRRARVNFRWGVRVPAEVRFSMGGGWLGKVPVLGLNKIGIEYVDLGDSGKNAGNGKERSGGDQVVPDEGFYGLKNRLDVLQAENGMLRKAIQDLRTEFANAAGKSGSSPRGLSSGKGSEMEKNGGKGDRKSGLRSTEADVNEELKKALKGAAGASSSMSRQ